MLQEKWPGGKLIQGKAKHLQFQCSVERVNREIKGIRLPHEQNKRFVLGQVFYYFINTSPLYTFKQYSRRNVFGREQVQGLEQFGMPDEIAAEETT